MRSTYDKLYNILKLQKLQNVSGFHNYSQQCYYLFCIPNNNTKDNLNEPLAKNDEILYIFHYLSENGYNIEYKDYTNIYCNHNRTHYGEIIATMQKIV